MFRFDELSSCGANVAQPTASTRRGNVPLGEQFTQQPNEHTLYTRKNSDWLRRKTARSAHAQHINEQLLEHTDKANERRTLTHVCAARAYCFRVY